uniref:Uncharacterized protein n=1 Tax=viral metagenome TaxID=1070528 RepID=A0A6C0H823_9ZZZZ
MDMFISVYFKIKNAYIYYHLYKIINFNNICFHYFI